MNEWNNKAIEITGFAAEDIMGKKLVEEFILDENKRAVQELMDNAMIGPFSPTIHDTHTTHLRHV